MKNRLYFLGSAVLIAALACGLSAQTPSGKPAKGAANPATAAAGYFPNTELVTHEGRRVKFFDDLLRDHTVVINFFFSTCTGVCPVMTRNLVQVQKALGDRVDRDIVMLSITVDPDTDTPQVLKAYANKFRTGPGWHFLTGNKADVETVLKKLGGFVADKNDHNTVLLVGKTDTGEWKKLFGMAKPDDIAQSILTIADTVR